MHEIWQKVGCLFSDSPPLVMTSSLALLSSPNSVTQSEEFAKPFESPVLLRASRPAKTCLLYSLTFLSRVVPI